MVWCSFLLGPEWTRSGPVKNLLAIPKRTTRKLSVNRTYTISANDWIEQQARQFEREFVTSRPRPRNHRMGFMSERDWRKLEAARIKLGLEKKSS